MATAVVDGLLWLVKAVGAPGSIAFFGVSCGTALLVMYRWPRRRALAPWWLGTIGAVYIALGTPAVAHRIADGLSPVATPFELSRARADVVVLIAGDNIRGRIAETLRAYRAWSPRVVIVSAGDDWTVDQLVAGGLPRAVIVEDQAPANTFEQMAALRRYQQEYPSASFALVASRLQMLRIARIVDAMDLTVTLLPAPADAEPPRAGLGRWIPRYTALRISRDAIYERAALEFYGRWRGFDPAASIYAARAE